MNTDVVMKLEAVLKSLLQLKENNGRHNKTKELLDTADLKLLFSNSERTIQRWRKEGKLKFVNIAGSIYYHFEDVMLLLQVKDTEK